MKTTLLTLASVVLLSLLPACVSVRDEEPETVSTTTSTRRSSVIAPTTTTATVERTTVY